MAVYRKGILPEDLPLPHILAGIVVLVALLLFLNLSTVTIPLSAELGKNPLHLAQNDSTILRVTVWCPCSVAQQNVLVTADAPAAPQLSVYPKQQTISSLGPNESRTLEFLVTPIDTETTPFLPGKYTIQVKMTLNGQNYELPVSVNVEK